MTKREKEQFEKLCNKMTIFMEKVQKKHPHATLFIEDGNVDIYDWPPEIEERPDEKLAEGGCWLFASGGGA